MKPHFPIILILFLCISVAAQQAESGILTGKISDRKTGKPILAVNVFINNTTIGASTDADGEFVITDIPPGSHELVIACVGYEYQQKLIRLTAGEKRHMNIRLRPQVYQSNAVDVEGSKAEHKKWQKHYKIFKREFLGRNTNASQCHILNPEVLDFENTGDGVLLASAQEPFEVMNYALGYKAFVFLTMFSYAERSFVCRFKVQYQELVSEQREEDWIDSRSKAFGGSFRHFVNALASGELEKEGFYTANTKGMETTFTRFPYVHKNWQEKMFSRTTVDKDELQLHFPDYLEVRYINEKDEITGKDIQLSYINLTQDSIRVNLSGYTYETVIRYGRWGRERFADMLPLDYPLPDRLRPPKLQ